MDIYFALKTFKPYFHWYFRKVITAWSSGTGTAGPIVSLLYAGITLLGISPRDTVRIMLIVPALQAITFWFLLRSPSQSIDDNNRAKNIAIIELNNNASQNVLPDIEVKLNGVKAKLKFIPKLAGFITPLVIVFIFEYVCVSGLVSATHRDLCILMRCIVRLLKYFVQFYFRSLKWFMCKTNGCRHRRSIDGFW